MLDNTATNKIQNDVFSNKNLSLILSGYTIKSARNQIKIEEQSIVHTFDRLTNKENSGGD